MSKPLLEIQDLHVHFNTSDGVVEAINGATLSISAGEVLGLVGESGSGKSVTAMSVLGLVPQPPAIYPAGKILWKGTDLLTTPDRELRGMFQFKHTGGFCRCQPRRCDDSNHCRREFDRRYDACHRRTPYNGRRCGAVGRCRRQCRGRTTTAG